MFSNLSSSSISLATVTPSLVMRGAPKLFSITTLRPFGPSVTFTALARTSTPRSMRSRASPENLTSLAAMILDSLENGPHPEERASPASRRMNCERKALRDGSFAAPSGRGSVLSAQHAHDVALLHDQEFL